MLQDRKMYNEHSLSVQRGEIVEKLRILRETGHGGGQILNLILNYINVYAITQSVS
jgi:hypothetical protein